MALPTPIWWGRTDQASGIVLPDGMGANNAMLLPNSDGVWSGGTLGVAGPAAKFGTAVRFNGTGGYGAAALSVAAPLSVCAWVVAEDEATDDIAVGLMGDTNSTYLALGIDGSRRLLAIAAPGGFMNGPVLPSGWVHIAMGLSSDLDISLWINGEPVGGDTLSGVATISRLLIGSRGSRFWTGDIAHPRIYNVALTPEQIAEDMAGAYLDTASTLLLRRRRMMQCV